jgi:hypothetical protein
MAIIMIDTSIIVTMVIMFILEIVGTTDVDIADTAFQVGGAREGQSFVLKV